MNLVVIGAGAIGGSLGAYLIRAGHEVLLVDNAEDHVRVIRQDGLRIEGREDIHVRAGAVTPKELAATLAGRVPETVILTVKAQHTEQALRPVIPLLGPNSVVVSMQNGLNPMLVARAAGSGRTLAACINSMAADYLEPGRILFGGPGTIRLGELDGQTTDRVSRLTEVLQRAYVSNTCATDNIWGHLWGKEAYGAWLFASATSGEPVADVLGDPDNQSMLANLAAEVIRVAEAEGIRCEAVDGFDPNSVRFREPRDWAAVRKSLDSMAALNRRSHKPRSGIWRDLAIRRRDTEVDAQLGIVVELGAARGIPAPLVERLVVIIHALERGQRAMDPTNLAELRALDSASYPEGRDK
jgi:2-dehydropantoate 2-reductase